MDYLSNFEKYIHFDEQDPLVQLAMIHAQFEITHPFLDGNGRLGRILRSIKYYHSPLCQAIYCKGDYMQKDTLIFGGLAGIIGNIPKEIITWGLYF
jgi:hypothetical protein